MKDLQININVKYNVGLGTEAPEKVIEQLKEVFEENITLDPSRFEHQEKYEELNNWLLKNIKERDCCDIEYEIVDLQTSESK